MVAAVTMSLVFAVGCDRGSHPETVGKLAPLFVMSDGVQTVDMGKLKGPGARRAWRNCRVC